MAETKHQEMSQAAQPNATKPENSIEGDAPVQSKGWLSGWW